MSFVCETCNSTFRTRGNLVNHTKSAKYCIKLRDTIVIPASFLCNICSKDFLTKHQYQQHYGSCSSHVGYIKFKELSIQLQAKLDAAILERDNKDFLIDKLRFDLQQVTLEAVKRPTNVTNHSTNNNTHTTNINNLAVFVKSDLVDAIERFPITKQIMDDGVPGVAKHVGTLMKTHFNKPNYMVTNEAKQKFTYKLEDGTVQKDYKSKLILDSVGPHISDQATNIYNSTLSNYELVSKIKELENTRIPSLKKFLLQFEQQIKDIPSRQFDHPEKIALNQKIENTNLQLISVLNQLKSLKNDAIGQGIRLDVPIDYYEDDLDKTTQNLRKIKNLKDHNISFSKTLIETIT
jgi:hypothetical protein